MPRFELPSVEYEPPNEASLFDRWEAGDYTSLLPPISVRDADYRALIVRLLGRYITLGTHLVSIGAGNGFVECDLAKAGWDVLATDRAESALRVCRSKGLRALQFQLMQDGAFGTFDAIYCDGVMGHLWRADVGTRSAWSALADLSRPSGVVLAANELADDDEGPMFAVRTCAAARFFRPPVGWFGLDAMATGRWRVESQLLHAYMRGGTLRRREIVIARLLVDKGKELQDSS